MRVAYVRVYNVLRGVGSARAPRGGRRRRAAQALRARHHHVHALARGVRHQPRVHI